MRNFLLLTTTKGSSLHRCTHTRKCSSGLLQLPAMTGKPRRWWPFKSNPCPNVIQIRHFLPCPNAQQQCTQAATTRAPPCSSCHYTKTLQYILKIRSNGFKSSSQKLSQKLAKRSPHAARGSPPPFLLFNTTTTTLPRMATKPSRPLKRTAKHTRRGSKRCEFLHAFDIRHCWIILTTISRLEMRKQRIGAVESKALEGERRWDWNRCRCHDTPRSQRLPPSGRVHLLWDSSSPTTGLPPSAGHGWPFIRRTFPLPTGRRIRNRRSRGLYPAVRREGQNTWEGGNPGGQRSRHGLGRGQCEPPLRPAPPGPIEMALEV